MNSEPIDDLPNNRDSQHPLYPESKGSLYDPTESSRKSLSDASDNDADRAQSDESSPVRSEPADYDWPPMRPPSFFVITESCQANVMDDLTWRSPEHAGALFGPTGCEYLVTGYESFTNGGTPVAFKIDGPKLTEMIQARKPYGMELRGIVHSHPAGVTSLSWGDVDYVTKILRNPKNDQPYLFMPIVCRRRFLPFVVSRNGRITNPTILLLPEEVPQHETFPIPSYRVHGRRRKTPSF